MMAHSGMRSHGVVLAWPFLCSALEAEKAWEWESLQTSRSWLTFAVQRVGLPSHVNLPNNASDVVFSCQQSPADWSLLDKIGGH